jgi:hypothetical protein
MSVCIYCDKRTRIDRAVYIGELTKDVMCAPCAKRRGTMPHDLFLRVALHEAEEAMAAHAKHVNRLRYAAGITETAKPAPQAEVEKLSALMDNWEDEE